MNQVFLTTLNQTSVLLFIMFLGYILCRKKLLDDNAGEILSKLETYLILPALIFNSFSQNFKKNIFFEERFLLLTGLLVLAASFLLALLFSRFFTTDSAILKIYIYAFTISNNGYMGYSIIQSIFGDKSLFKMILFCMPANIFIYTVGMMLLTPKAEKFSFKFLLNPCILAMVLGVIAGIGEFPLPSFVTRTVSSLSACMAPIAMLLTGFIIAKSNLISLLKSKKAYFASAIRLILFPVAGALVLNLIGVPDDILLVSIVFLAMPVGLNTVVFPAAYGGNSSVGAGMAFISHVLSIITIPIIFALFLS